MAFEHCPVMVPQVLEALALPENALVVDGTLGLGGYSEAFLEAHPGWKVIGVDQDEQARGLAAQRLESWGSRFEAWEGNFRHLGQLLENHGLERVHGIVVDLGVSNLQITEGQRGFSFRDDGPLDMRMDRQKGAPARDLVNQLAVDELTQIFTNYGEERFARSVARQIEKQRQKGLIETTGQLVEIVRQAIPAPAQRKASGHPARRIFQALRIAVNDELGALEDLLNQVMNFLVDDGRFVALSYHSLEDRLVKRAMRAWEAEGLGKALPRNGQTPDRLEIESNPKARSARLRTFVKGHKDSVKQGRIGPWRR